MDKEVIQEFTIKIAESNRTQLLVNIFDLILISLKEANEYAEQGEREPFKHSVGRAQGLVRELMEALDFNYAISLELLQLYLFVNRRLLQALAIHKSEPLEGLDRVIGNLRRAFEEVSREDRSAPLMQNTQKIYAGLTYGRTTELSETCHENTNRGYQA